MLPFVDRDVRAELPCLLEPRVGQVDHDDAPRCQELRRHHGGEPDRAGTDDRDRVARLDTAGEHADLVGRGEDVRQEDDLLVRQLRRELVDGRVRERHPRELRLEPIDQVTEDPAAATGAEAVAALLAESAATAGRDAGNEHAIAGLERGDGVADLDDCADGLVAEDSARLDRGDVALENVKVGPADRRGVDPDDRVGRILETGVGNGFPRALPRPVEDERFHSFLLSRPRRNQAGGAGETRGSGFGGRGRCGGR